MASAIIHNTTIVTGDDAGAIHHDAALVVHDRRIADIGSTTELLARYPDHRRCRRSRRTRSASWCCSALEAIRSGTTLVPNPGGVITAPAT